jgi:anti-sigma factor RsiW
MSLLSDELLIAYVDGQLGETQAASVARMVASEPELHRRLARFQRTQAQLIELFEALALRQPPEPRGTGPRSAAAQKPDMSQRLGSSRSQDAQAGKTARGGNKAYAGKTKRPLVWALTFALIAACGGYAAAKLLQDQTSSAVTKITEQIPVGITRWAAEMAQLHAHFSKATVEASAASQENPELVIMQLSRLVQSDIVLPDLTGQGLSFRRGQIMSYRGSQLMQLSYSGSTEPLVALYIMAGGPSSQVVLDAQAGIRVASWSTNSVRFVLAADMPENQLRALTAIIMAQMSS